jgi:putative Ca2+/H+ antiporter (TMEM165/GDT1 family)
MPCTLITDASAWLNAVVQTPDWAADGLVSASAFALVAAAELGDKSQLVCMTLASRHRHWPVFWGALLAFALLNIMAVIFGAVAGAWLPEQLVAIAVALLFAGFGIRCLLSRHDDDEVIEEKSGHGIFITTFLMIFLAELGDKTQIAVAGMGAAEAPLPVWLGATAALAATSALGIWAGRTLLRRISPRRVAVASGLLFLVFALMASLKALPPAFWISLTERLHALLAAIG